MPPWCSSPVDRGSTVEQLLLHVAACPGHPACPLYSSKANTRIPGRGGESEEPAFLHLDPHHHQLRSVDLWSFWSHCRCCFVPHGPKVPSNHFNARGCSLLQISKWWCCCHDLELCGNGQRGQWAEAEVEAPANMERALTGASCLRCAKSPNQANVRTLFLLKKYFFYFRIIVRFAF